MANTPSQSLEKHITRRRAIASVAAVVASGGAVTALSTRPARAAVSVDSFGVEAATITAESPTIVATLECAYDYDTGNEPVSAVRFGFDIDGTEVDSSTLDTSTTAHSGTRTLSGDVTASDEWSQSDFEPAVGSEKSREVSATATLAILDDAGDEITADSATDANTVTVRHPQRSVYTAAVGGTVTFANSG